MPIVVEDGTGTNPEANSYIDAAYALSYASDRGLTLASQDQAVINQQLFAAMDYLNGLSYIGFRLTDSQPLDWPRKAFPGVYQPQTRTGGTIFPVGTPSTLKQAQARLVFEISSGVDLFPTISTGDDNMIVTEETVGPITTQYAASQLVQLVNGQPILAFVDKLLKPLIQGGFGQLTTYRV